MSLMAERMILVAVWGVSLIGLVLVPKRHRRKAQVAFLFQQFLTWILGLIVVQNGWLSYPLRELKHNFTSLTFEIMAYPTIAVYLNIFYPAGKRLGLRILYIVAYPAGITLLEIVIETYTELIDYHSWSWYWTFLSTWVTLHLSLIFNRWFFRENDAVGRFE
ncbi:hypothetical protein GCM10008018_28600 [Paenibacillus marchantiophytorum]|uniref:Uncharacterized protein n=1 Tax=Paenibacillus marchantiophytorum TaxID=1619310 RepID=A0ABQ1EPG1_9BACL|nr:CBO0543 family protein [Paenibacillus marchantiophytorum]GFZ81245.1 hypothetical protein GCM10008018_28600 [Paenibacillus marchantiophytorum]